MNKVPEQPRGVEMPGISMGKAPHRHEKLVGMKLEFDPEDEEGYSAANAVLLEALEQWLREDQGLNGVEAARRSLDAGVALSWKWSYGDGDLGRWSAEDVAEFLFEWCPRKLSVSPDDSAQIPSALKCLLEFLEANDMLAAGSYSVEQFAASIELMSAEFVKAMGDVSKFGLAKSLFGAAANEGVDISEPDQLEQWMAEFNNRPEEERRRLLPDSLIGAQREPERPRLPPVALPHDDEITASMATAPVLAKFGLFASFVGEGRKLTQKGNLTPADARALVPLLGTRDIVDQTIGDHTFKMKSSSELRELRQLFAWAKKAGVLRIRHGRVIATKRGLTLMQNPANEFDRVVDALFAIGPLSSQRETQGWFAWPDVDRFLDEVAVHLLTAPYVSQRPIPFEDLAHAATMAVHDAFEFRSPVNELVATRIPIDVMAIVDTLEIAGLLHCSNTEQRGEEGVDHRYEGGTVELTPAGVAATRRLLMAKGYDVPVAGRFADATASELLAGTDFDGFPTLWGELEAWRRRRTPEQAVSGLAEAVRDLDDPALRSLALAAMSDIGPGVAAPFVRELALEQTSRGLALCWLVDHEFEDRRLLFDAEDPDTFVDVLACRLVTSRAEDFIETLSLAGNHDQQIRVMDRMWRSPSTATESVLVGIAEQHPAKVVAKAARKAAFKRRSWLGNH